MKEAASLNSTPCFNSVHSPKGVVALAPVVDAAQLVKPGRHVHSGVTRVDDFDDRVEDGFNLPTH